MRHKVIAALAVVLLVPVAGVAAPIFVPSMAGVVFAPQSDTYPYAGLTTDDVYTSTWSVWMGFSNPNPPPGPPDNSGLYAWNQEQPQGYFGIGAPLAPLGPASAYILRADGHLYTYDVQLFDVFSLVITEGGYLWDAGRTLVGGFQWGGSGNVFELHTNDFGYMMLANVAVPGPGTYFVNVVLQADGIPGVSWGRFSDVTLEAVPVPEPVSLLLLGTGLVGLARLRKRRG